MVVGALKQRLGLRVGRAADITFAAQHATKRVTGRGQLRPSRAPPADRPLPVPHQHSWNAPEALQQQPPTGIQVLLAARGNPDRVTPAGVAAGHRQDRQLRGGADLPGPHRQHDVGKPEVELGDLARQVRRARGRVRRQVHRPQLRHPLLEHRHPPIPADPLGDHRGRHPRVLPQQLPDPRLDRIDRRPLRRPLVPRRRLTSQCLLHRVARHPGFERLFAGSTEWPGCLRKWSTQGSTPGVRTTWKRPVRRRNVGHSSASGSAGAIELLANYPRQGDQTKHFKPSKKRSHGRCARGHQCCTEAERMCRGLPASRPCDALRHRRNERYGRRSQSVRVTVGRYAGSNCRIAP